MRVIEGAWVRDLFRVKDDHVGKGTRLEHTAILQTKRLRWQLRHAADGFLQGQHLLLTDIAGEDAGIVAITTRMRDVLAELPRPAIAGDHGQRMFEEGGHVRLIHAVEDATAAAALLDVQQQLDLICE